MISPIVDFLATVGIPRRIARLRFRYFPEDQVDARFDQLLELGYLSDVSGSLCATDRLQPVLDVFLRGRITVTDQGWGDLISDVATANRLGGRVIEYATSEHEVARLHREVPEPPTPPASLLQRLVTLRYIRQHDHAASWIHRGISPGEMGVLTTVWNGEGLAEKSENAVASLLKRGWLEAGGDVALSAEGREVRDDIETETNERSDRSYSVLGDDAATFLETLRRLPGES